MTIISQHIQIKTKNGMISQLKGIKVQCETWSWGIRQLKTNTNIMQKFTKKNNRVLKQTQHNAKTGH